MLSFVIFNLFLVRAHNGSKSFEELKVIAQNVTRFIFEGSQHIGITNYGLVVTTCYRAK